MRQHKNTNKVSSHIVSVEEALTAELAKLLAWQDGLVGRIAQRINEKQDWASLPILADALEDAGCTVQGVLDHLREDLSHVGFCYVTCEILRAYRPQK